MQQQQPRIQVVQQQQQVWQQQLQISTSGYATTGCAIGKVDI